MTTPQQIFSPQFAALQSQFDQLQNIYNDIMRNSNPAGQAHPAPASAAPTSIPFVSGLDGAREYLRNMPANSSAAVFDQDDAVFYTLSVDANGTPAPIKVGRFSVEDAPEPVTETPLTKKDFDDFKAEIRAMLAKDTEATE